MSDIQNDAKVLLTSVSRTATTNSTEQDNKYGRAVILVVRVTTPAGDTLTLQPVVQTKEMDTDNWVDISGPATINGESAAATYVYYFGVGATNSDSVSAITDLQLLQLPRIWRLSMVHSSAEAVTYSVTAYTV